MPLELSRQRILHRWCCRSLGGVDGLRIINRRKRRNSQGKTQKNGGKREDSVRLHNKPQDPNSAGRGSWLHWAYHSPLQPEKQHLPRLFCRMQVSCWDEKNHVGFSWARPSKRSPPPAPNPAELRRLR